ncbi:MAG: amidohydrolase family protein [Bacteroidales bacterium]|jgi:cytosine/adenosine deaminase-related metal-dependent hydrolase
MKLVADYVFPIVGEPIKNGYVELNEDGVIVAIGEFVLKTKEAKSTTSDIEFYHGILVPGFVNSHCHVELSHLKGAFLQGTGMDGFIKQINESRLSVDYDGRIAAMSAEFDSLYSQGVSAMADISNCDESFDIKSKSNIYTRTFLEVFGTEPKDAPAVIDDVLKLQKKASDYGIDAAPTPHSCYTMSPELNRMAAYEGLKSGFISYHNQESDQEEDMIKYGTGALAEDYKERGASTPPVTGKSALIYFLDNLQKICKAPIAGNVLLIHNVVTDQESIDYAKLILKNIFWTVCPLSNMFIHRALPPLDLLRNNNLLICLGTDSLSSNMVLSMVEEIKCIQLNYPHIRLQEILEWACINGAKALGKEKIFGSFEPGKKPGVVLIENVDLNNMKLTAKSKSRRLI